MTAKTLGDAIRAAGSPVKLSRNSQIGPYAFPVLRAEYTNWRDEQRAWTDSCALLDLSYHMTDLYVDGPDALKLFADLSVNSFQNFRVGQAKQLVLCNHSGYVISDGIIFHLDTNKFNITGRPPIHNWVQFNLETRKYDAVAERDERAVDSKSRRKCFRFQIQGPQAANVMERVLGKPAPDIRFFHMGQMTIGGLSIRALRHGMAGQAGWELFGPFEYADEIKNTILAAGQESGIRQVGARAYPSATLESGWIPSIVPAVYHDECMKEYREWLGADSYEAKASLGGSFDSEDINDYYLNPFELGQGQIIKYDHDFVGRTALEQMSKDRCRQKVTLVWNPDEFAQVFRSLCEPGDIVKYLDLPVANYATIPFERVLRNGTPVGVATSSGYTYNKRAMISLGVVDKEYAQPGTELTLIWGESDRGSAKPTVERHRQIEIPVTVAPVPFSEVARTLYRNQ